METSEQREIYSIDFLCSFLYYHSAHFQHHITKLSIDTMKIHLFLKQHEKRLRRNQKFQNYATTHLKIKKWTLTSAQLSKSYTILSTPFSYIINRDVIPFVSFGLSRRCFSSIYSTEYLYWNIVGFCPHYIPDVPHCAYLDKKHSQYPCEASRY